MTKDDLRSAATIAALQFANWCICTISWRAVAQANIPAAILTDTTLATLQFFVIKHVAKDSGKNLSLFVGYTVGGVAGTVAGICLSLYLLGK